MAKNGTIRADPGDRVVWVTLDRPDKANALTNAMLAALKDLLEELRRDPAVRVVVFTGAGDRFFCSGFDVGEIANVPSADLESAEPVEPAPNLVDEVMMEVAAFSKPTLACINGGAFGTGCELAMACDLRVASESAELAMPPARVGVLYSAAGMERFVRLAGLAVAKEMFFSARRIPAARACAVGLVNHVVPPAELRATVDALARDVAANAPRVIAATKRWMNELSYEAPRWTRLEAERDAWRRSGELAEGLRAIRAGRKPAFSDG